MAIKSYKYMGKSPQKEQVDDVYSVRLSLHNNNNNNSSLLSALSLTWDLDLD